MVRGWDRFREHFSNHQSQYTIIGGTATMLLLEQAGLQGRATKDIDIILALEVLDPAFGEVFWAFIDAGKYKQREKSDGAQEFFRFLAPDDETYPYMIEIFCRKPDTLKPREDQITARIPIGDATASLSAILLDDDYCDFVQSQKMILHDVPIADAYGLIALKSYAWVRLTKAKEAGDGKVKSDDIRKHHNDVFRLYQMLDPQAQVEAPPKVRENLRAFIDGMDMEKDLKQLGLGDTTPTQVAQDLKAIFRL